MCAKRTKKIANLVRFICATQFMIVSTACSYDPLTITGKVVDESGSSLSDVSVRACYSGWGRGDAGYLVWDKDFCSETTHTDQEGLYIITFKGPVSSRLMANKDGWVQTQDYNTTHSRIILTKSEDHSSRLRAEGKRRDQEYRQRLPEESETDYYCRVVLPEKQYVNLSYQDETLAITPTLLVNDAQSDALFAVRGSRTSVNTFSDDLVVRIDGEVPESDITFMTDETNCDPDVHFIGVNFPGLNAWPDAKAEILVPSISAMFEMRPWVYTAQQ
jgi:hypothetical protein